VGGQHCNGFKEKGPKACKVFDSFCKESNVGFCKMTILLRELASKMSQFL